MTSYLRLNAEKTGRPILFAFNGGPGSASVFLHLGGLGPQIIDLGTAFPRRLIPLSHERERGLHTGYL